MLGREYGLNVVAVEGQASNVMAAREFQRTLQVISVLKIKPFKKSNEKLILF